MLKKIIFALVLSLSSRAFCTDFVICMGSFRNYDYAKERLHLLSLSDIPVFIAEMSGLSANWPDIFQAVKAYGMGKIRQNMCIMLPRMTDLRLRMW